MQTVEAIIAGSRKIDEMRKRINETIKLVKGLAHSKYNSGEFCNMACFGKLTFSNEIFLWRILYDRTHSLKYCPQGYYVFGGHPQDTVALLYADNDPGILRYKDVQFVYENLYVFVDGMIKTFPEIAEKLQPFLKASKIEL